MGKSIFGPQCVTWRLNYTAWPLPKLVKSAWWEMMRAKSCDTVIQTWRQPFLFVLVTLSTTFSLFLGLIESICNTLVFCHIRIRGSHPVCSKVKTTKAPWLRLGKDHEFSYTSAVPVNNVLVQLLSLKYWSLQLSWEPNPNKLMLLTDFRGLTKH